MDGGAQGVLRKPATDGGLPMRSRDATDGDEAQRVVREKGRKHVSPAVARAKRGFSW
jgi:hypothetical protein